MEILKAYKLQHHNISPNNILAISDIGIPNGPAEDSTRGLLKAHYPKNKKIRKPKILLRKARVVIESLICNLAG
jgi:hypothetical protein